MKSSYKLFFIIVELFMLAGYSLAADTAGGGARMEGLAAIAPTGVLPPGGFYAAGAITDFPPNTTLIVTNLVNGKTAQVTVNVPLDNPSFLILLSKEAADEIALSSEYPGRVRVEKLIDPLNESRISNGDPDYDPLAQLNASQIKTEKTPPIPPVKEEAEKPKNSGLTLVEAENRLPDRQPITIPKEAEIPPIKTETKRPEEKEPNEFDFIDPLKDAPPKAAQPYSLKGFAAPVLTTMEKGKYYLQLRSYNKPELVNSEIERIEQIDKAEKKLLLVHIAEVSGKQVYRIIIGPITLSESDRLLRKYQSQGWVDAFVWVGR